MRPIRLIDSIYVKLSDEGLNFLRDTVSLALKKQDIGRKGYMLSYITIENYIDKHTFDKDEKIYVFQFWEFIKFFGKYINNYYLFETTKVRFARKDLLLINIETDLNDIIYFYPTRLGRIVELDKDCVFDFSKFDYKIELWKFINKLYKYDHCLFIKDDTIYSESNKVG